MRLSLTRRKRVREEHQLCPICQREQLAVYSNADTFCRGCLSFNATKLAIPYPFYGLLAREILEVLGDKDVAGHNSVGIITRAVMNACNESENIMLHTTAWHVKYVLDTNIFTMWDVRVVAHGRQQFSITPHGAAVLATLPRAIMNGALVFHANGVIEELSASMENKADTVILYADGTIVPFDEGSTKHAAGDATFSMRDDSMSTNRDRISNAIVNHQVWEASLKTLIDNLDCIPPNTPMCTKDIINFVSITRGVEISDSNHMCKLLVNYFKDNGILPTLVHNTNVFTLPIRDEKFEMTEEKIEMTEKQAGPTTRNKDGSERASKATLSIKQNLHLCNLVINEYTEKKLNDLKFAEYATQTLGFPVKASHIGTRRAEFDIPATIIRGMVGVATTELTERVELLEAKLEYVMKELGIKQTT